jgi:hypothetical protein
VLSTSRARRISLCIALGTFSSGCRITDACSKELTYDPLPSSVSVKVGQSVTQTITGTSCGDGEREVVPAKWSVADTSLATVDSMSGRIVGLRPGTTTLRAAVPALYLYFPLTVLP